MLKFVSTLLMFLVLNINAKNVTLTTQNSLALNGPVNGSTMKDLMVGLQKLNKIQTEEPIYLVINSPGGSVYDGFDFIRFAESSKRKIHTVTLFAASMGFQIVQALGDRYVTSYSTLMSHKASGTLSGEFPGQLDSRYAHILSHIAEQDKVVVSRTKGKQTLESYAQLIKDEYWANNTRALKDGFADESISVACDDSLGGSYFTEVNLGLFSLSVQYSNCPLIVSPLSVGVARGSTYLLENKIDPIVEFNKLFKIKQFNF